MDHFKRSFKNKEEIIKSDLCGCYHCYSILKAKEIKEWVDSEMTPICPFCFVDSIIPYNKKIDGSMQNFKKELEKWNKLSFS